MFRGKGTRSIAALAPWVLVWSAPARGQGDLEDRHWIEGSAFWAKVDSKASVAARDVPLVATEVDFESDLALSDSRALPSVSLGTRLGDDWQIGLDIYSLRRSGTQSLRRDIVFDGVTYPASAQIDSSFNSDIYRLTVGYVLARTDQFELGAAIGVHATNFELSLDGVGRVGNNGAQLQAQARRRDLLAPLPTIGLFATWQPMERLSFSGRADYLSLKIGDYDGRLANLQAGVSYRVLDHLGLGIMYRHVNYRVGVDKPSWSGTVKYRFSGPAVSLRVGF